MNLQTKMTKYHVIVPVWGDEYIDVFSRLSLPTQLSPGNLGRLATKKNLTYCIYTRTQDVAKFCAYPAYGALQNLLDVRIIPVEDVYFNASHHYEPFSACYRRGMLEALQDSAICILLTADQVFADGALTTIISLGDAGRRVVLTAGPRVTKETFVPAFLDRYPQSPGSSITLAPGDAVQLAMEHLHPWDRTLFWGPDNLGRPASFMFWSVGQEGFIMRNFHLLPILVNFNGTFPDFSLTIDAGDLVRRVCPDIRELYVVEDSDQVMYFTIAPRRQSSEWINRPKSDWRGIITWAKVSGLYKHNIYYLTKAIRFHVGEMSDRWSVIQSLSDDLVDRVTEFLDKPGKLTSYRLISALHRGTSPFLKRMPAVYRLLKRIAQ
jgi:hypothetical protein